MSENANLLILSVHPRRFRNFFGTIPVHVKLKKGAAIQSIRWIPGVHNAEYTQEHGYLCNWDRIWKSEAMPTIRAKGACFEVHAPGTYTLCVQDDNGRIDLSTVSIKHSIPFLLAPAFMAIILSGIICAGTAFFQSNPKAGPMASSSKIVLETKPVVVSSHGTDSKPVTVSAATPAVSKSAAVKRLFVTDNIKSAATFPKGSTGTVGELPIENVKSNPVIIQAQLVVGGTVIATSQALKPGQSEKYIILTSPVASGNHSAYAYISYYDLKTQDYITKVGYKVGISVD